MSSEVNGFFSVPKIAVSALMDASATAKQIGGYLVLAKFTDSTGVFSRAGKKAISTYLGVGDGAAGEIVNALKAIEITATTWAKDDPPKSLRLVLDVNEWLNRKPLGGEASDESSKASSKGIGGKTQWVVNDFDTSSGDRVWFPNSLVAGTEKFGHPLIRLIGTRSDATVRALLLLYSEHDEEQIGGVRPCRTGYVPYSQSTSKVIGSLNIAEVTRSGDYIFDATFRKNVMCNDNSDDKAVSKVIHRLEQEGFIYRAVTAMDGPPQLGETEALYCLDVKSACDSTIGASDDTLAVEVNAFTKPHGIDCTDSVGRFYTKYPVVLPEDYQPHVAEIIRLRFRINDENVGKVNQGFARAKARHAITRSLMESDADAATDGQSGDDSVQYESFVATVEASEKEDTNSGNREGTFDEPDRWRGGTTKLILPKPRIAGRPGLTLERWGRSNFEVEIEF